MVEGEVKLREFIASMLSLPMWVRFLFRIRAVFARLLGLKHEYFAELPDLLPKDIPMTPGGTLRFFTVRMVKEEQYWIAESPEDKHLRAFLGVVVEPLNDNLKRFHVITVVHYKHWTGPGYFNTIRPFHHLIVSRMARAGAKHRNWM